MYPGPRPAGLSGLDGPERQRLPDQTTADYPKPVGGEEHKAKVRARYGGTSGDWSGEVAITISGAG